MQHDLKGLKCEAQSQLLALYKKANAGHIGSSLSCLDVLLYLFQKRVDPARKDRVILSKGHAAGALYVTLAQAGYLDPALLETFYQDGTSLAAHTPCSKKFEAIPFGTGSLGHGLSLATGIAFAQRFETGASNAERSKSVYAVLSEGDCNEGSTWEAVLFAGHHRLRNLTVIVDANGLQGLGPTHEILNLEPLVGKWTSFHFNTYVIENGNDLDQIHAIFEKIDSRKSELPVCIIARTTKGSGVSYMENQFEWHYHPMSDAQYQTALTEIAESRK